MPFPPAVNRVPTAIGPLRIKLYDPTGDVPDMKAEFTLVVLDQDGAELRVITGDLTPYITTAQRNGLIAFMQAMRAQAVDEVLTP